MSDSDDDGASTPAAGSTESLEWFGSPNPRRCVTPSETPRSYFTVHEWRSLSSPRVSRDDCFHSKSQSCSNMSEFKHMMRRNSRSFENLATNLNEIFRHPVKTQSLQSLLLKPKSPTKKLNFEKNIFLNKLLKGSRDYGSVNDLSSLKKNSNLGDEPLLPLSPPLSPCPSHLESVGPAALPSVPSVVRFVFCPTIILVFGTPDWGMGLCD